MGAVRSRPANSSIGISQAGNGISSSNHGYNNESNVTKPAVVIPRERGRHGVVHVKISSLTYANRRSPENETSMVITPRGAIFHGSATNPAPILRALANCGVPMLPPIEVPISDSRAHKLMLIHTDDWYIVPSQEPFSRHSGTCVIIGDKKGSTGPYKIKLGDCFRLGSVGVVVSEIKTEHDEVEQRLDARKLQYLKDEALAFDSDEDMAALAADEEQRWRQSNATMPNKPADANRADSLESLEEKPAFGVTTDDRDLDDSPLNHPDTPNSVTTMKSQFSPEKPGGIAPDNYSRVRFAVPADPNYSYGGIANGERFVCYMCYETHDTPTDPLVAPCDCKGDTRYLHVQCLQKWYHSSVAGPQARVIRTTGSGAPACKICGVAYKTTFKRPDGRRANLLEMECKGPYVSLVVVTRHDTNPGLFNTKFRLNFGRLENEMDQMHDLGFSNSLLIGRSSTCNMVLDYRTVSTVHAKICYENGEFTIQDRDSSNGTMVYLQAPMSLKFSSSVRVRMGRTTMTFQAKRSWTAAFRSLFSANFPYILSSNEAPPASFRHSLPDISAANSSQPGRRSSSTGALPSQNNQGNGSSETGGFSAAQAARRRFSGGVDVLRSSAIHPFMSHTLTADELQQIMTESNLLASATNANIQQTQDNQRGGTNPRSSPNTSLRDEDIHHEDAAPEQQLNEDVLVRRILFHADGNTNDEEDHPPVDVHPAASVSSSNSRRNSSHRGIAVINVNAPDIQHITPPLSPVRHHSHDARRESSIIVDDDATGCAVGTSFDLMLESSTAAPMFTSSQSLSPTSRNASSNRAFDRDGPVTVPPAGVFALNHVSGRSLTANTNADMNNA